MPLILLIIALCGLRFFEVWRFADLSWWYIVGLMVFAFVWFEFIEKMLGLDKKKDHRLQSKQRAARVKQAFDKRR
ncbi:TIGR04438 family Trp-rich protein [Massilia sp. H6]|uniref:TIGR04438 family Trp-rich protein n=1 Tax=Massilia sp. H6 TaxID=2970464 RepID=UPI0021686340|nr:TIGR04438 family Trp-rich protein [Massilia sp. H6]UVW28027.1 TIGR04438 family Trp-rich protein [Massilia sp. H6]